MSITKRTSSLKAHISHFSERCKFKALESLLGFWSNNAIRALTHSFCRIFTCLQKMVIVFFNLTIGIMSTASVFHKRSFSLHCSDLICFLYRWIFAVVQHSSSSQKIPTFPVYSALASHMSEEIVSHIFWHSIFNIGLLFINFRIACTISIIFSSELILIMFSLSI